MGTGDPAAAEAASVDAGWPAGADVTQADPTGPGPAAAGAAGAVPADNAETESRDPAVADGAVAGDAPQAAPSRSRRAAPAWLPGPRLARHARTAATHATAPGPGFARLTLVPVMLVIAWLLPAIPLLLGGSFDLAPMLVISIPLGLVLTVVVLGRLPARWPMTTQARPDLGGDAPLWALLATVALAAGFTAWQIVMKSQQLIVTRDPGVYLQFGYWIAHHGSVSIPQSPASFGGAHPGLSFASVGFVPRGTTLSPQFLAGLPVMLAAGFWAGGASAAQLVTPVLGGLALFTFGGLVGRLAGPRWAPAGVLVLALALPEQYVSRTAFAEPLTQILLFGGLCLLIDSLCVSPEPVDWPSVLQRRLGLAGPSSPAIMLAALGGLALGLTAVVRVDGLSDALPAIPLIGVMFAARRRRWLPFAIGLLVGVGYGLAEGYLLARPYLDSLSSWMAAIGLIAGGVTIVTLDAALVWRYARLGQGTRRVLAARPLRWLPEAAAALTVLVMIGFAVRPYVQTVRGDTNPAEVAYVGYMQRVAGLPLDPTRLYAEDTLYWVIWYIGLPALLLGVFGLALVGLRVTRALITWKDPSGAVRLWALPLMIIGWVMVTVLWRPGTVPDQPWASRRLVPVVLPGLILAAVWATAWLIARARERGTGRMISATVAVLCVGALLLPTTLTTFGVGVAGTPRPGSKAAAGGLALQPTGLGETRAVLRLCASVGPGASVVIVDPRVANEFTQLIRGMCDVPVARMNLPPVSAVQPVLTGITGAHRRPVLLGSTAAQVAAYGVAPREVLNLVTTQDAHVLTHPPASTWPARYVIWMSQPS